MPLSLEIAESVSGNPIDLIEEMVEANDWPFQRSGDDELVIEMSGRWCAYRLLFLWQDEYSALQVCCHVDLTVPQQNRAAMSVLVTRVNERMWIGHFDLGADDGALSFRHTALLRGLPGASPELIEDIVEAAIVECERFHPALRLIAEGGDSTQQALDMALMDPVGEA